MININQKAPVQCSKSITIHVPGNRVWEVLTNIDKWSSWNTDISSAKLNGVLKTGTTFDWKTGGAKIHSTLHTVEPYQRFGWTGKAFGVYAIHNWTFTEGQGQTRVFVEESMEGFFVSLLKKMFMKNLQSQMEKWLAMLKQECERIS